MDGIPSFREEEDPDYSTVGKANRRGNNNLSLQQQDAREQATQKIENIIHQQFAFEMRLKEREIEMIDHRISQAKVMLDRLRACILAKYYGTSEAERSKTSVTRTKSKRTQETLLSTNRITTGDATSTSPQNVSKQGKSTKGENIFDRFRNQPCNFATNSKNRTDRTSEMKLTLDENVASTSDKSNSHVAQSVQDSSNTQHKISESTVNFQEAETLQSRSDSRFYIKKQIIIGNTSKYIPLDKREANDKSTHKWMVYVRGPPEEPHLDKFINKVWFFLHPSYRPNDIVEVSKQPFHLTRRGWGEFPVRVQLHFVDPRNKRVDIIHELKLDRTYTGLQTLGAETVVDLQLDRRTFPGYDISTVKALTGNETQVKTETATGSGALVGKSTLELKRKTNYLAVDEPFNELPVLDPNAGKHFSLKRIKMETSSNVSAQSSAMTTPFSSCASSRCTSPEPEAKNLLCKNYSSEVEKYLQLSVRLHPLIVPSRNISKSPYAATSLKEFLNWNIGKQRACELQRSLAMKRYIRQVLPSSELTTKDVTVWCRRHAYTPCDRLPDGPDNFFCIVCGRPVVTDLEKNDNEKIKTVQDTCHHEDCLVEEQSQNSLSNCDKFLSAFEEKEQSLPELAMDNDDEEIEVDVITVEDWHKPKLRHSSETECLPQSEEQSWVRSAANEIGVALPAVNLDGVHSCVLEEMILSGCKQLIDEVLRKASACAADQSSPFCPKLLLPIHLHKALVSLPHCDFLSNSALGILVEKSQLS